MKTYKSQSQAKEKLRLIPGESVAFSTQAAVMTFKQIGKVLGIHPEAARRDYRNAVWKIRRYAKQLRSSSQ